jgi:hypothetical protein
MKTDDLVALLAKDAVAVPKGRVAGRLLLLCGVGAIVALALMLPWLGMRPDIVEALQSRSYWMKTVYTLGLAVGGFVLIERLSRPGARGKAGAVVVAVCLVAIAALAAMELMPAVPGERMEAVMGGSWNRCSWRILALAMPGLAAILYGVRQLAPTRLTLAGAAAGLLAGGVSATVYGLHCDETAAPFVAIWYTLGIALSAAVGAIVGRRVLAW